MSFDIHEYMSALYMHEYRLHGNNLRWLIGNMYDPVISG